MASLNCLRICACFCSWVFLFGCGHILLFHWLQESFRICCKMECVRHSPLSELRISLLCLSTPAHRMQHCFSNSSIHKHWWQMFLLSPFAIMRRGGSFRLSGYRVLKCLRQHSKLTGAPWDILKFWAKVLFTSVRHCKNY